MGYKVLLVDHGSGTVERLRESLERAGHETSRVAGVVEALIAVERTHPDVVMIDDGGAEAAITALCGRLKDEERGRHMPVIVLVDRPLRAEDRPDQRSQRIGCDHVVEATIPVDTLLGLCAELVDGPSAPAVTSEPSSAAGFAIEQANRDSASAESFSAAIESPLHDGSPLADASPDDGGRDIQEHLDSLFATPAPPGGDPSSGQPQPPPTANCEPLAEMEPAVAESTQPVLPRVRTRPESVPPPALPSSARPTKPEARPGPVRSEAARVAIPKRAKPPAARSRSAETAPGRIADPGLPSTAPTVPASNPIGVDTEPNPTIRRTPNAVIQLTQPRVSSGRPVESGGRRRATWVWIAAGTAVVLVAILAGWLLSRRADSEALAHDRPQRRAVRAGTPGPSEASPALPAPPALDEAPDYTGPSFREAPTTAAASAADQEAEPAAERTGRAEDTRSLEPETPAMPGAAREAAIIPPEQPSRPAETNQTGDASPQVVPVVPREPASPEAAERSRDASGPPADAVAPPPAASPTTSTREPVAGPAPSAPEPDTSRAEPVPAAEAPEIVPPEVLERFEPTYSPGALKKAPRGAVVVLRILVDAHGRISRVVVDQGIPGSELEAAAISAVLRWRFRAGTEAGQPVDAWTSARFEFDR